MADKKYLLCEKNWVYYILIAVSGFYGAFTYLLRGNVFCNAQTGNVVLMGLALGLGEFKKAGYYLIPISSYMLGAFVSEILPKPIKHTLKIRWDTLLIAIEMGVVVFLGLLPESAPVQISQIAINFIASMQYNTFRQAQGTPVATTFVTNHIRQVGVGIADEVRHINNKDKKHREKWKKHSFMLLSFFGGVTCGTVLCNMWRGKAIFAVLLPLLFLFVLLVTEDVRSDRDALERVPNGH